MVQRTREKLKRPAGSLKASAAAPGKDRLESRLQALERERDALKAELEAAKQQIAALEESRTAVASRIDWVIESLSGAVYKSD
jgi:predicted  nucleic acid-binding Zn-ribbon protein